MTDQDVRPEFRESLRVWFRDQLSERAPRAPLAPPAEDLGVDLLGQPPRPRPNRLLRVAAAVGAVGGLVAVFTIGLPDRRDEPGPAMPRIDVASRLDGICQRLHTSTAVLPWGAGSADVEAVVDPLVAALTVIAADLADLADLDVDLDQARQLLAGIHGRVADLPELAIADDVLAFDDAVTNVDLLLVAWGREMTTLGAQSCASVPTLRERS